jgi:hypothetical protein
LAQSAAPEPVRFSLEITPVAAPPATTAQADAAMESRNGASEMLRVPAPAPAPAPQQRALQPSTSASTRAAEDGDASSASRRAEFFRNRGAGGRGGGFGGGTSGLSNSAAGASGRPDAVAKAVAPAPSAPLTAQRWNFRIAASRDLQNAQVRLILPPTLSFAGVVGVASRAVWRGDLEAGKPAIFEVSLIGARGSEKISVVLEQIGDKQQSKPVETQIVALPAPNN